MVTRRKRLVEFGGFAQGAGPGFPDAGTGRGYGRVGQGALGTMRQYPQGYPYTHTLEDMVNDNDDDDEDEYEIEDKHAIKIKNTTLADRRVDATYNSTKDRRTFASSNNQGMFNYGTFGESNFIRLRPRSSEPSTGTMYGWSHPHLTTEPDVESDENFYRYSDIRNSEADPDAEFHRLNSRRHGIIRRYVREVIRRYARR